jgi:hypothetical protein
LLQPPSVPGSSSSKQQQQQEADPWTQGLIRLQYLPPEVQGDTTAALERLRKAHKGSGPFLHKQKNWNPFIYQDTLYFSQVCFLVEQKSCVMAARHRIS